MKKLTLILLFMVIASNVNAETWVPNYGYWENSNEISAKKDLINIINPENIFDFNTSPNEGGEKIVDGKYYLPIMYNGANNGTDTDYIYVDDLKGEKGDTGAQGLQGNKGDKGDKGDQGSPGTNGINGTNGLDGKDGKDGAQGPKGDKGKDGLNAVAPQTLAPKLENRQELILEGRLLDTKRTTWSIFAGHDFGNDVDIVGAKLTVKLNQGYYEKKIEEQEKRLDKLEKSQYTLSREDKMEEAMNRLHAELNNKITLTKNGYSVTSKF